MNRSVHTLDILTVVFVMVDVVDFFFFCTVQQMAGLVTDYMEAYGTKFAWKCVPNRVDKLSSGALQVTWTDTHTGKEHEDTYDSVLWAVGESVCGTRLWFSNILEKSLLPPPERDGCKCEHP